MTLNLCKFSVILFLYICLVKVSSKNIGQRKNRGIWGPYTATVTQTQIIQSFVPSSCVQVAASLPPCRNVRLLQFPSFISNPFNYEQSTKLVSEQSKTNNETASGVTDENTLSSSSPSWGEYLGIYPVTTTVTKIHLQTSVVEDPRIMVTFAVKGCRPLKLPLDLKRCPEEAPSTVEIPTIIPTSTVHSGVVEPTQNVAGQNNVVVMNDAVGDVLESTNPDIEHQFGSVGLPTPALT